MVVAGEIWKNKGVDSTFRVRILRVIEPTPYRAKHDGEPTRVLIQQVLPDGREPTGMHSTITVEHLVREMEREKEVK